MGTRYPDLWAALMAPFAPSEVKARPQGGRQLSYVTARTVENRLDAVLGPEGWWDEYTPGQNSVMCRLSVRLPDGTVLTKCDAGGYAGMADQGDDDKSGFSDAFKRAAVKFGVGRYLYQDGVPRFDARPVSVPAPTTQQRPSGPGGMNTLPMDRPPAPAPNGHAPPPADWSVENPDPLGKYGHLPTGGGALFAWAKKTGDTFTVAGQPSRVDLVRYLDGWLISQGFVGADGKRATPFKELAPEVIRLAVAEACRKLYEKEGLPVPPDMLTCQPAPAAADPWNEKDDPAPFDGAAPAPGLVWERRKVLRELVRRLAEHYHGPKVGLPHVEDAKDVIRAAMPAGYEVEFGQIDALGDVGQIDALITTVEGIFDVLKDDPTMRFGVPVPGGMGLVPAGEKAMFERLRREALAN